MKQTHKLLFICMIALINGVYMFPQHVKTLTVLLRKWLILNLKTILLTTMHQTKCPKSLHLRSNCIDILAKRLIWDVVENQQE